MIDVHFPIHPDPVAERWVFCRSYEDTEIDVFEAVFFVDEVRYAVSFRDIIN